MTERTYILTLTGWYLIVMAKVQAYQDILSPLATAQELEILVNNFRLNFGKTRLWHMEVAARLLKVDVEPHQLSAAYGKLVSTINFELIQPNVRRIKELSGERPIFVSGSSADELARILPQHFVCDRNDIYGSPEKKMDVLRRLKETMTDCRLLYFGDSLSDLEACEFVGIDFVGLYGFSAHKSELVSMAHIKGMRCIETLVDFHEN